MDIEDSSVPYRAFLRSGSYPAITERFVRSGGALARAAGWAALVVSAASAGYMTTQRFVSPSAADPSGLTRLAAARAALAPEIPAGYAAKAAEPVQEVLQHESNAEVLRSPQRSSSLAQPAVVPTPNARKRTGAVLQEQAQTPVHSGAVPELEASVTAAARAEQIAERVRALDSASQVAPSKPTPAQNAVSAAVEAVLRDESEHEESAHSEPVIAPKPIEPPPLRGADVYQSSAPRTPRPERSVEPTSAPSLPLTASARIAGLVVRGPLSAAHVRRSVERVQPALSGCYSEAARQAGHNRFAPVRVRVTIDEAGRVKMLPTVDGAQLPGLGECLSTALSKLVCQAPDTGTAHASITLGFVPERR